MKTSDLFSRKGSSFGTLTYASLIAATEPSTEELNSVIFNCLMIYMVVRVEWWVVMILTLDYVEAPDVKRLVDEIADRLDLFHVVPQFVYCYRSRGSKSEFIIARIHGLGRIWQEALRRPPTYVIEVLSERYDKLSDEEKEKTLIHELLHIPEGFSGGFRPHKGYIDKKRVEKLHRMLLKSRYVDSKNKDMLKN